MPTTMAAEKQSQLPEAGHRGGVSIADFPNDTGQQAPAFGRVVGLRIGADLRRDACPVACCLRPAQANRAKQSQSGRVSGSRRPTLDQVEGRLYQEPIMRNKAKLGQDGTSGGRRAREGPMVQNKPNLRRDILSGKCWKERKICGIAHQEGGGRTKPISVIMPIGRSAFPGSKRAKQTQCATG